MFLPFDQIRGSVGALLGMLLRLLLRMCAYVFLWRAFFLLYLLPKWASIHDALRSQEDSLTRRMDDLAFSFLTWSLTCGFGFEVCLLTCWIGGVLDDRYRCWGR